MDPQTDTWVASTQTFNFCALVSLSVIREPNGTRTEGLYKKLSNDRIEIIVLAAPDRGRERYPTLRDQAAGAAGGWSVLLERTVFLRVRSACLTILWLPRLLPGSTDPKSAGWGPGICTFNRPSWGTVQVEDNALKQGGGSLGPRVCSGQTQGSQAVGQLTFSLPAPPSPPPGAAWSLGPLKPFICW